MNQTQALCPVEELDDAQFLVAHFAAIQAKSRVVLGGYHLAITNAKHDGEKSCQVGHLEYCLKVSGSVASLTRAARIERMAHGMARENLGKDDVYFLKPCRSETLSALSGGVPAAYLITEYLVIRW